MTSAARASGARVGQPASYQVTAGSPEADRDRVLALWREGGLELTGAADVTRQRFDWLYLQNPQGLACLNLLHATEDDSLVGMLGVGRRTFHIGTDAPLRAGLLVDFVVSPDHRSAYPALTLQRQGRAIAQESMEVLYGLPAPQAVAICKRLEYQVWQDFPRYARVLRFRGYVRRMLPGFVAFPLGFFADALVRLSVRARLLGNPTHGEWLTDFDPGFDELWSRFDRTGLCIGVRDRRFLQWRFRNGPRSQCDIYAVRSRKDGSLRSYFVCTQVGEIVTITDCLSLGSELEITHALLMLAAAARRRGAHSIAISIKAGPAFARALQRAGFSQRSQRPFFAVLKPDLLKRAAGHEWYLTQADEDI
jgi:hypothetical protein